MIRRGEPFGRRFGMMRRTRRTDFSACSKEERALIFSYLLNMIRAGYDRRFTDTVFSFCVDALEAKTAYALLKPLYPSKLDPSDMNELGDWAAKNLPDRDGVRIIRELFAPRIAALVRKSGGAGNRELMFRLDVVRNVFRLSREETAVLSFFYLLNTHSSVSSHLGEDPLDLTNLHLLKLYGSAVLGLDRARFRALIAKSRLFDAKLIDDDEQLAIDSRISDYLLGIGDRDLKNAFFSRKNDADLAVRDFSLAPAELGVLTTLLKGSGPCNILFYGAPGTGKTSLAKVLARQLGLELYTVRVDEGENEFGFRLKALYATLNAAPAKGGMILVDEADELLNTDLTAVMSRPKNSADKSWVNNLLDGHERKIIWITNRTDNVEPSTLRRFSFSREFEKLTVKSRLAVLLRELDRQGLAGRFPEETLRELCKTYAVDAGGIVHAVRLLKMRKRMNREGALRMAETVLRNHEKATTGAAPRRRRKNFSSYSLAGLNASPDLDRIVDATKLFSGRKDKERTGPLAVLLYGPPGTGKTEFVHYLGDRLDKDVILKRASDIQDAYVGQTEKNIARAFREAEAEGAILFFDEADSFFYPRKDAVRSWEKSFTNESLAQLDDYAGTVIFATNDIDGLDHAAIRRFRFKVRFSPLAPGGCLHFYETLLQPLAARGAPLSSGERAAIAAIRNLTPGDFAVVKAQYSLGAGRTPTHRDLIAALEHEVRHKKGEKKVQGFGA